MLKINQHLTGFQCIRCEELHPIHDYHEGCPKCQAQHRPASVVPVYDKTMPDVVWSGSGRGMRRFSHRLPYCSFESLGEGDTPIVDLPRLAGELGMDRLSIKLEGANPTGSHKDRMSVQFVARAKDRGAHGVVAASSGNAGASVAAYAAAAGLPCIIVTTPAISPPWRRAIEMTGAEIIYTEDSLERWAIVRRMVRDEGYASATNYLDPPVGSDPWGVDGYKTLGYELAEDEATADIEAILVPTARGDLLWGIYQGLADAVSAGRRSSQPRLVAVEPFPRLEKVLAGQDLRSHYPGRSLLVSIGGATVTFQSWLAVTKTRGAAVSVAEELALADQRVLARHGLFLELSAAASLTGLRRLLQGGDQPPRSALLIATSHGYKESAGHEV
ncbi:threonine synthase [Mesorhizobium australicum]|uniref:Threonine synthase n=1 Tax=Mesorhizobium australicum TaxID=536018 RepID=A0A1X7MZ24_9HYPH|nr:PLP-dependent lyase/thiolase [Mesorhizobium australicum]SMH29552.1 threonine synthase [Mesorhizobium australicum]